MPAPRVLVSTIRLAVYAVALVVVLLVHPRWEARSSAAALRVASEPAPSRSLPLVRIALAGVLLAGAADESVRWRTAWR